MHENKQEIDINLTINWLRSITIIFNSSQIAMAKLDSSLQNRYKALGQRAIVELLVKVLDVFESHSRVVSTETDIFLAPENADLVPALVNALFDQLMPA